MVVGDFNDNFAGHEALAVGASGTRFYSAKSCTQRWAIANSSIPNPRSAAWLARRRACARTLFVQEKAAGQTTRKSGTSPATAPSSATIASRPSRRAGIYETANVDGVLVKEDRVAAFGYLIGDSGSIRLGTGWYWDQQQLTSDEQALIEEEKWTFNPLVFDLNRNGRDEIIVWGRHALVIGEAD